MLKRLLSIIASFVMVLSLTTPALAAVVTVDTGTITLYKGNKYGEDITNQPYYYVGDELYPVMRNTKTGAIHREGRLQSFNGGTSDVAVANSYSGPNGGFVFTNPGVYKVEYLFAEIVSGRLISSYSNITMEILPRTDKSYLLEILNYAKAITRGEYTVATWNALQNQIPLSQTVYDDKYAAQTAVDTAYNNLVVVVNGLKEYIPISEISINYHLHGTVAGVINQTDRTITFTIPQNFANVPWQVNKLVSVANNTARYDHIGNATDDISDSGSDFIFPTSGDEIYVVSAVEKNIRYTVIANTFQADRINAITVKDSNNNEYVGDIDPIERTITFFIAPTDLYGGTMFSGSISSLNTDNGGLITIKGPSWEQNSKGINDSIFFTDGDNAFIMVSHQYIIEVEPLPIIRGFTFDGEDAVIDQQARTITVFVDDINAGTWGSISNYDADGSPITISRAGAQSFITGDGSTILLYDGDKAYINDMHQYTIVFSEKPAVPVNKVTSLVIGGYSGELNAAEDTFTFNVPLSALTSYPGVSQLQLRGDTAGTVTDTNTITFSVGNTEYPFNLPTAAIVGIGTGDKVYAAADHVYNIVINELPIPAGSDKIRGITIDGYAGIVDESAKTITFNDVPLSNDGEFRGTINALDADGSLTFYVNKWATAYPGFDVGGTPGFYDGDKVYVSADNQYTIYFAEEAEEYDIAAITIDGHIGEIDQDAKTITFSGIPLSTEGEFRGEIDSLEAKGTLTFYINKWAAAYPDFDAGSVPGFYDGDKVYVSADTQYTILFAQIREIKIGGFTGDIDQLNKTITFNGVSLSNGEFYGTINHLEADGSLTFYLYKWSDAYDGFDESDAPGFYEGDKVYVSESVQYTLHLNAASTFSSLDIPSFIGGEDLTDIDVPDADTGENLTDADIDADEDSADTDVSDTVGEELTDMDVPDADTGDDLTDSDDPESDVEN